MKKTLKVIAILISFLMLAFILASCSDSYYGTGTSDSYGFSEKSEDITDDSSTSSESDSGNEDLDPDDKIVRTVEITGEAENLDNFTEILDSKVSDYGGYYVSSNVNYEENKRGNYEIKIPADDTDSFTDDIAGYFNIISKNESQTNITSQYVDTESKLKSLRTEYDALLSLMEKAETVEDILTIQNELTEVRGEIESYESQIDLYDSQVSYSTFDISVNEVVYESGETGDSFFTQIWKRIKSGCIDIVDALVDFAVWFIGALPYWILLVLIAVVVVLIVKGSNRRRRRKKARMQQNIQPDNVTAKINPNEDQSVNDNNKKN